MLKLPRCYNIKIVIKFTLYGDVFQYYLYSIIFNLFYLHYTKINYKKSLWNVKFNKNPLVGAKQI
jgi:hypothetical protein